MMPPAEAFGSVTGGTRPRGRAGPGWKPAGPLAVIPGQSEQTGPRPSRSFVRWGAPPGQARPGPLPLRAGRRRGDSQPGRECAHAPPTRTATRRPAAGWSLALVDEILSNPKYTGHQVMGRRRFKAGKRIWMPASEWIWSAQPTHAALVDMATWDAAQRMGRRHGNVRDPEMPSPRTGRRYKLRSRLYCSICHRRMTGTTIRAYTYYRCPHDPGLPRHYAAHPGHRTVAVREEIMVAALARFFTERVFGPDRAAQLTTQLPATAAGQAERRDKQAAAIRRKIARLDSAETALITELETPADPTDPAAQGLAAADPRPVHRPLYPAHHPGHRASRPRRHSRRAGQ